MSRPGLAADKNKIVVELKETLPKIAGLEWA